MSRSSGTEQDRGGEVVREDGGHRSEYRRLPAAGGPH